MYSLVSQLHGSVAPRTASCAAGCEAGWAAGWAKKFTGVASLKPELVHSVIVVELRGATNVADSFLLSSGMVT
jgi:hypothetical protein